MKLAQLFIGGLLAASIHGTRHKIRVEPRANKSADESVRLAKAAEARRARRNAKRARDAAHGS